MTLLQHYQLGLLLIGIASILVAIWVLFQKGNKRTTRLFLIYSSMIAFWGFCQAQAGITDDPAKSLFWIRIMFLTIIPAPGVLMYFFAAVLKEKPPRIARFGLLLLLMFMPFLYSDDFLREGAAVGFLQSFPRAGPLFLPFNLIWAGWVAYALSLLAKKAAQKTHPKRMEARFLLIWFTFGYITGSVNYLYLYGIYLFPFQPFGSYGVSLSWIILAYGIFTYRIFDTRLVIRRSLVYSLLVTLLTVGYFGLIYTIEKLFQNTFRYQSFSLSLAAFALMALTFQPLKAVIQRLVDWAIFRAPQEEIAQRMERLEEQALQAEKFKAVSTLAAGMAHEIKNPLTTLKTFTEFIPEKQNDPAFLRRLHEVYTTEINRIQTIVKDLLEFSKPRSPELKPIDLGLLITSTVNFLSSNLLKQKIQWTIDCQHNGSVLQADANQLQQVLINLIQNAADAMLDGGQLTIATETVNSHLELTISDTGSGIPATLLPKIFDPFVTTKPDGNGLGLAMVYSIIHSHRGFIRANSAPGRGTTFTVTLPL